MLAKAHARELIVPPTSKGTEFAQGPADGSAFGRQRLTLQEVQRPQGESPVTPDRHVFLAYAFLALAALTALL
ncbi:hypothetical protein [Streptomyces purpurascens]|uniref:hypothetical protein n=1 Tax=Streptomyces purpurascens TaxID=1924 RepID=UPI003C2E4B27